MAIKSKEQDIAVIIDPLSSTASIEVIKGYVVQTYNQDLTPSQFEPDRRVLPCVLMPTASVVDPDGIMSGTQPILSVKWYENSPSDANRIIENTPGYEISAAGTPQNSLSIKKNLEPTETLTIHAIFTVKDTRRGTEVTFERSIELYTSLYDSKAYSLRLKDQPSGWTIDPLRVVPDSAGHWYYNITAQLFSGHKEVPDGNAAYWWQIQETGGQWRDFTQDEKDIFISGENTKVLRFDARFIRNAAFRCRAAYYKTDKPTAPDNASLVVTSAVKVEMPHTLSVDIRQKAGARVDPSLRTNVIMECIISDNKSIVPDSKMDLFRITWKAKSGKVNSPIKTIGTGRVISFTPSSFGFDVNYSMAVYAEVEAYAIRALVVSGGKVLISGGKAVTAVKFE